MCPSSEDGMFPSMKVMGGKEIKKEWTNDKRRDNDKEPELVTERKDEGQIPWPWEWIRGQEGSASDFNGNTHVDMGQVMLQNEKGPNPQIRFSVNQASHCTVEFPSIFTRSVSSNHASPLCLWISIVEFV